MAKSREPIIRKLPLPLEVKIGSDGALSDGFFSLTSKEVDGIIIKSIDEDGYAVCEVILHTKKRVNDISVMVGGATELIGTKMSKTRGSGKDFGQYKYYKRPDGSLYAVVSGARTRKIQLGKPTDKDSSISVIAKTVAYSFNTTEFAKKDITKLIPKRLRYGQMLKALLDVMTLEGYLEKRETKSRGRLRELFKATDKLKRLVTSSEQAQNELKLVTK